MKCVTTVKRCYDAIVTTLQKNYEKFHDLEVLGISGILTKQSILSAIYIHDFILQQDSKLS